MRQYWCVLLLTLLLFPAASMSAEPARQGKRAAAGERTLVFDEVDTADRVARRVGDVQAVAGMGCGQRIHGRGRRAGVLCGRDGGGPGGFRRGTKGI